VLNLATDIKRLNTARNNLSAAAHMLEHYRSIPENAKQLLKVFTMQPTKAKACYLGE